MAEDNPNKRHNPQRSGADPAQRIKGIVDDLIKTRPYTTLVGVFAAGFLWALIRR
jgi:hypothetical protein